MKYFKGLLTIVLSFAIAGFALAQNEQSTQQEKQQNKPMMQGQKMQHMQQKKSGGMMSGGMHGAGMMKGHMMGMMSGGMMGMHAPSVHTILMQSNRLNLSTDQVKALQQQSLDLRKDLMKLHSQLQKQQLEYQEYLLSDDVQQSQVTSYIEENQDLQTQMQKRMAESYFNARQELDQDQQENLIVMFPGMQMMQQSGESEMGMDDQQQMMQQN